MAKSKKPGGSKRAGYRVGYGKPPKHSQFKKGASGNPRGRRKGSKNRSTLIRQAARGQTVGETPHPISRGRAAVLNLAVESVAGDPQALTRFLDWIERVEAAGRGK